MRILLSLAFLVFVFSATAFAETEKSSLKEESPATLSFGSSGLTSQIDKGFQVPLSFKLGGRAQFDRSIFDPDETNLLDDSDFRRLRLKAVIQQKDFWKLQYSYDFESEATQDAYFAVNPANGLRLTLGQFKTISSLASRTSSNWLSFAERAPFHSRLLNERGLGFGLGYHKDKLYLGGTLLTETVDNSSEGRAPWQFSAIAVYRPILSETEVLHLGLAHVYQVTDDSDSFSLGIGTSTQAFNSSGSLLGGSLPEVENYQIYNSELIYLRGAFDVRNEFALFVPSDSSENQSREAYSFYTSLSYFLNGGSSNYKASYATFSRPNLADSRFGTWQVAARYSFADQTNANFGNLSDVSIALNFFPTKNIRLTGNINYASFQFVEEGVEDEDILAGQLRAQLVY